jgi:hypothetical protein
MMNNFLGVLMKSISFYLSIFICLTFSLNSFSRDLKLEINKEGDSITLSPEQIESIALNIENEASDQVGETKETLERISSEFRALAQDLTEPEKKKKKAKKVTFKKILRGLGKGSTFVSVNLVRPFVSLASFFTGFFEKPGKNMDAKAFLQFFLNHEKELSDAWKNTGNLIVFAGNLQERLEVILLEKQVVIIRDLFEHHTKTSISRESVLKSIGVSPFAEDDSLKTIQELAFDTLGPELMFFKIDVDFINEHPDYQELRPLIGDLEGESLDSITSFTPDFDLLSLGNRSRLQLHEGLVAFSSKIFIPKLVIGIVAKSISSVVTVVGLAADVGTAISTLMCTVNKKGKQQLAMGDKGFINFCSYVVNKSAYVLSRSRARGYVSGKNFRRTLIKKSEKIKRTFRGKRRRKNENGRRN